MATITIKESAPYCAHFAPSESYGHDYMARISSKTARELCAMYPVPQPGNETCIAVTPGKERLCVANIGGVFVVRCASAQIIYWPATFGIEVKRIERE